MLLWGAADVTLTPTEPLPLGGYTARRGAVFQPGGQDQLARVRIVGGVAWVVVEGLTMPESLVREVRLRLPDQPVFLWATHTHCAPDTQLLNDRMTMSIPGIATFRRRWLVRYADLIAEGVRRAKANATQSLERFEIRRATVPQVRARRPLGVPDPSAVRIEAILEGGRREVLMDIYGAHPTLLDQEERTIQGDWVGALMRRTGGLAVTGALGDVSPVPPAGKLTPRDAATTFALDLDRALRRATPRSVAASDFSWSSHSFRLPKPVPHPEFASANGVTPAMAEIAVARFAPQDAEISMFRWGHEVVFGIPGEPSAGLARHWQRLAATHGLRATFTSHANGWAGYLLDPSDYDRGGYEAQLTFYGRESMNPFTEAISTLLRRI